MVRATSRAVLIALCTLLTIEGAVALTCTANQYVSSNACTNCATGYVRAAGDDSTGSDTACFLCAENYYVSALGADATTAGTCTTCGSGRGNPLGDDSTSTGTLKASAAKGCLTCLKDFYLSAKGADTTTAGTCTGCTAKSYVAASTATSAGTVNRCLFRKCSANQYVSNGECMNCPAGLGRSAGDDSSSGDTMCNICLEDYHLTAAGTATTMGTCSACPSGQTTGDTTSSLVGESVTVGKTVCTKCKAGFYPKTKATNGAGDSAECVTCGSGLWSAETDVSSSGTAVVLAKGCQKCAAGFYVAVKSSDGNGASVSCLTCGTGGLSSAAGVDASSSGTAVSLAKGCQKCAANYYVAVKSTDSNGASVSCLTCGTGGKTTATADASSSGAAFTSVDKGCLSVAADYYVSAVGADALNAGTVTACATGTTNAAADSSNRAAGTSNPSGTAMSSVLTQCENRVTAFENAPKCLVNQFVSSHECVDCPTGYTRDAGDDISGANTACLTCKAAYRVAAKGADATTAGTCTACPTGFTTASAISNSAGTVVASCLTCKAAYRVAAKGADATTAGTCTACPTGFTTDSAISTSAGAVVASCLSCAEDYYVAAKGADATTAGTCTACPSGTAKKSAASMNVAGDLSTSAGAVTSCDAAVCASASFNSATAGCTLCAENFSVATKGATLVTPGTCTACAAGTTNAKDDLSTSAGAVTTCDKTLCAVNNKVETNACVACAAGTTIAKDGDASGADTTCTATKCAVNQYVKTNVCTACATGTTIAKDGDASGADTACGTNCAVNQYVKSNVCTACATGTTNAAGDMASGANTSCDKTTCAINEYVKSNVCTACVVGTTNVVGDDASGVDTTCDAGPVSSASRSDISFAMIVVATLLACAAL